LLPDIAAPGHAQWVKDFTLHHYIQRFLRDCFDHLLQVHHPFSRVTEPLTRREVDRQGCALSTPVGKAGSVAQYDSCRDFVDPWIALKVRLLQIVRERNIQSYLSLIHQTQHRI
jgi:hypothetical protein